MCESQQRHRHKDLHIVGLRPVNESFLFLFFCVFTLGQRMVKTLGLFESQRPRHKDLHIVGPRPLICPHIHSSTPPPYLDFGDVDFDDHDGGDDDDGNVGDSGAVLDHITSADRE